MNKTINLLNIEHERHTIVIDRNIEIDFDGNESVAKHICYVITPNGDSGVFNVSPYTDADEIEVMAKVWVACGCPDIDNPLQQKWTNNTLILLASQQNRCTNR